MDVAVSKVDVSRSARSFHHRALFFSSAVVGTTSVAGDAPVAPEAMTSASNIRESNGCSA